MKSETKVVPQTAASPPRPRRNTALRLIAPVTAYLLAGVASSDYRAVATEAGPTECAAITATASTGDFSLATALTVRFDALQQPWNRLLQATRVRYEHTKMVLYREAVDSACGSSAPAMGSFYCPTDRKVYVDFGAYLDLRRRFPGPADLAQAFILSHEIAHHLQALLRQDAGFQASPAHAELQADCLAGVAWSRLSCGRKPRVEIEDALAVAFAAGPGDSTAASTHGTPAQRADSFRQGLDGGRISACYAGP